MVGFPGRNFLRRLNVRGQGQRLIRLIMFRSAYSETRTTRGFQNTPPEIPIFGVHHHR